MSGLSLAVIPRGGSRSFQAEQGPVMAAFVVVFSASGLVPYMDLIFPVFVTIFLWILSKYVFPSYYKKGGHMEVFHASRNFDLFVILGIIIGLCLPLAYVLGGFARGDRHAVKACTPHLFLLSAQILSENLVSKLGIWSPPVRAYLVAIYNARRIFSLVQWVFTENDSRHLHPEPDYVWIRFGRVVAVANLIYFSVTMYFFIIPRFIPTAFQRYYEAKAAATQAKTSGTSSGSTATHAKTSGTSGGSTATHASTLGGRKAATGLKLEKKSE